MFLLAGPPPCLERPSLACQNVSPHCWHAPVNNCLQRRLQRWMQVPILSSCKQSNNLPWRHHQWTADCHSRENATVICKTFHICNVCFRCPRVASFTITGNVAYRRHSCCFITFRINPRVLVASISILPSRALPSLRLLPGPEI